MKRDNVKVFIVSQFKGVNLFSSIWGKNYHVEGAVLLFTIHEGTGVCASDSATLELIRPLFGVPISYSADGGGYFQVKKPISEVEGILNGRS